MKWFFRFNSLLRRLFFYPSSFKPGSIQSLNRNLRYSIIFIFSITTSLRINKNQRVSKPKYSSSNKRFSWIIFYIIPCIILNGGWASLREQVMAILNPERRTYQKESIRGWEVHYGYRHSVKDALLNVPEERVSCSIYPVRSPLRNTDASLLITETRTPGTITTLLSTKSQENLRQQIY